MQSPDIAGADGRPASPARRVGPRSELDQLRATCRSRVLTIDALGEAVSALRREAAALVAENAELRAERDGVGSGGRRGRARASGRRDAGAVFAVRLPCDTRAPGAARILVADGLRDRVAAGVLDSAQLLITELVTNSVRHSGAGPVEAVRVRVSLSRTMVVLEVEDAGRGGVIAPRRPDLDGGGGGFGLRLVQALSERWGLERGAPGPTIVWAQLPRGAQAAPAPSREADAGRARPFLTAINQRAGGHRPAPAGGQP